MRVNRFGDTNEFHEFDVILTIESEEEGRALYAIFNYIPNEDILPEGVGNSIRKVIGERYTDLGPDQMIARGVDYPNFYRRKVQE